ncbi:MAG: fructoselysine 6-kinase [Erysipelotrichaceae bacterium]|nr:fructoselysine 6-kinase [Erysipelotrichaceae bacterium]
MKRLVCFGSCCIDFYSNLEGGKAFVGGGPVNSAIYAAELEMPVSLLSCVGSDSYGDLVMRTLQDRKIDLSHFRRQNGKTAVCDILLNGNETVLGSYSEGVMQDYRLSEDDIAFIKTHDMALTDLWGQQEGLLKTLKEDGFTLAFNAADKPDDPAAVEAMEYCDLFFFSSEEDFETVVGEMLEILRHGPSLVVALCTSRGSVCMDSSGICKYRIIPAEEIVDILGAADSYIAGFLKGYLAGESIEECMRLGSEITLPVLKYYGAFKQ